MTAVVSRAGHPIGYVYDGDPRLSGPIGTLSTADFKQAHAKLGRVLSIQEVNASAGTGDADIDTQAVRDAADQLGHVGTIYFPGLYPGGYQFNDTITFEGPIRIVGDGRGSSTIFLLVGFSTGKPLFVWDANPSAIKGAGLEGVYFTSSNNLGRVADLNNCVQSDFSDCFVNNLEDFMVGDFCYGNTFRRIHTNAISRYGIRLLAAGNNVNIEDCIFNGTASGAYGVSIIGGGINGALLVNIKGCSFESFDTTGSHAIYIAPPTSLYVGAINIVGNYFERVAGYCVFVDPVDVNGVRALNITDNFFFGGYAAYFGSVAGFASAPIRIKNVLRSKITDNFANDFQNDFVSSLGGNTGIKIARNLTPAALDVYHLVSGADTRVVEEENETF